MIQCPRCGGSIQEQSRFCPHCAYDVGQSYQPQAMNYPQAAAPAMACPVCGAVVGAGTQFCPNCSTPFQSAMGYTQPGYQQPGYEQPGYQQPGANYQQAEPGYAGQSFAPATASSKNAKTIIIAVIILVIVAGAGVAAYFFLSGSGSPSDVTKKFVKAVEKGDSSAISAILTKSGAANNQQEVAGAATWIKENGGISGVVIDKEEVSGNTATVSYTVKLGNGTSESNVASFVKEDGQWRLSGGGAFGSSSSPSMAINNFLRYLERGDADGMMSLMSSKVTALLPKEKMKLVASEGSKEIKSKGGIKSIDTEKEEITGDTATVTTKVTYGNGETKTDDSQLGKENGKWKLDMKK